MTLALVKGQLATADHRPGKSMNRKSTALTSFSRMYANTSRGVTVASSRWKGGGERGVDPRIGVL